MKMTVWIRGLTLAVRRIVAKPDKIKSKLKSSKKSMYFFSYYFKDDDNGTGFGSSDITTTTPVKSAEDIQIIADHIRNTVFPGGNAEVVILNWHQYGRGTSK